MMHALSVDVEDWYHDGAMAPANAADERVERNTELLLELFAAHGARATFFVLGEVAERFPALVRRIAAGGHELASHGHQHRPVQQLMRAEFREQVRSSLRAVEDATGVPVRGFRAPYFSIPSGVAWPTEILAECGVRYDSSILPTFRPPGLELFTPRVPYRLANGLWEVPIAILQLLHFWHLPFASGNGLRFLPGGLLRRGIARFERDVGPGVFYLHPWELDPESPTGPGPTRWLLRIGRRRFPERLAALLRDYRFAPIADVFPQAIGSEAS